uniref:Uncharacterized protein n=1 Tax=Haemonchus contortus TaxID=6289 RepID=A0A7I4XVV8_HAECO
MRLAASQEILVGLPPVRHAIGAASQKQRTQ